MRIKSNILNKNVLLIKQVIQTKPLLQLKINIGQMARFALLLKIKKARFIQHLFLPAPQQQWFREHISKLRYTYIACLVLSTESVQLFFWN